MTSLRYIDLARAAKQQYRHDPERAQRIIRVYRMNRAFELRKEMELHRRQAEGAPKPDEYRGDLYQSHTV